MTEELELKLVQEFPTLFRDYHGSPSETCMSWGCSCGDGWFTILWAMCSSLRGIQERNARKVALTPYSSFLKYYVKEGETLRQSRLSYVKMNAGKGRKAEKVPPLVLSQVKEKFGTLTVYYDGAWGDEEVRGIVSMAENMSLLTCESCGSTRDVKVSTGWLAVRCSECVALDTRDRRWTPVLEARKALRAAC